MLNLNQGLGRRPYVAAGGGLFAAKVGIDLLVARAFQHPYSILYYVSPSDAPLFNPGTDPDYWLAMWAVALPFLFTGLVLTLRRLRDAGMSPWLCLLFFAPFVNMIFFAFCALMPGRDDDGQRRDAATPALVAMPYGRAATLAGAAGAAIGLVTLAFSVYLIRSYGAALFIGAPAIGGFVSGVLFARWHRPRVSGALLSSMLALVFAGVVVIAFALEGIVCLAMASPLVLLGSAMGAGIGCLIQRSGPGGRLAPTASAVVLLPLSLLLEGLNPLPPAVPAPVESSIIVDAPPEVVWRHVIAFPPMEPPTEWIFDLGIAAPMSAVIDGEGIGAVRHCRFTTGDFVEPIEVWNPPRELRFGVTSSPDPMRERTLWTAPGPPHLDGYLRTTRGQFLLEPLPGGLTRLVGRTWYRTGLVPEAYWRLWSDHIIHVIHMRVLRHVAEGSERAASGSLSTSTGAAVRMRTTDLLVARRAVSAR